MTDHDLPPAERDLVFICGALRSGTTLLRLMINDHPGLSNPGEMDFLFEPPPMQDGRRDMAAYARELAYNRVVQKLALKFDQTLDYPDQVRAFVRQLQAPGKRLSINIHRHFDRIPEIFPAARYVHLLRDPRDVAKSSIGMGWAGNAYHGVDHWIASERDFEKLAAIVPAKRIHRMRNEDLVRTPEQELAGLCAFLGVAYDPLMLDYPSHTTYGPPDPRLVEQWRNDATGRDLGLVEGKLGDMLASRGYAPSGAKVLRPGPVERFCLRTQDRWGRWRFMIRRNGLAVMAADLVGRRLSIAPLAAYARRSKAAAAARHVK